MQIHCKFIANFSFFLLLSPFWSLGQDKTEAERQMTQKLATLDLTGLKTDFLLNKGVFTEAEIAYFRTKPRDKNGQVVMATNAEDWQNLYDRIVGADLRGIGKGRVPDFEQFAEKNRLKQSQNNTIPIGILNLDATLLTKAQLDDNVKQKQNNKKVNADKYEKLYIVSASVLQEDIYEANVKFKLSPELSIGNAKNNIRRVELDFQDGKGFQSYPLSNRLIEYRFESIGERVITIKLLTERGTYVFYSKVNVKQLDRPKVHREFEVSTEGISQDTVSKKGVKSGRTAISVVGGNVRIILSCDQYFDRPIIIAEGFDLGNDVGLNDIAADYRRSLQFLINRGYDLVLLDYHDARTAIENNAQVLKRVIREVNNTKQGDEKLVVIGESMSGLVARWALREMENEGENHNVKLYISFDSPHQGANIPVSVTNIYWEAHPSILTSVISPLLPRAWRNYYSAIQTPAATQMLLHYNPRWMPPMGGLHPNFQDFRNRLQALGNNGYPQQCRNVAITNGSSDGSDRALFTNYGYGSNIITSTTPYLLQNTYIEAYTNKINENSLNLRFVATGILFNGLAIVNYNSPFNDDFLPGGRSAFVIPQRLAPFQNISAIFPRIPIKEFSFCFVPTFSAIDFQGDRSNQINRESLNVLTTNQSPFARIYGSFRTEVNTIHVNLANWFQIAQNEGLLRDPINCPGPPQPVTPFVVGNQPLQPCIANNQSVTFTAVNTGDIGQFSHDWTLSPAAIYGSGSTFTFNTGQLTPGVQYTLVCRRRFTNQNFSTATSSYSIVFSICETDISSTTCAFSSEEFVYLLSNGQGAYARYQNGILYATVTDGDSFPFVSRATLIANGMPETFANCFAETDPRGGTPSNSCASGSFNGYFDYANCSNFGGWVLDQNNFGRTVDVDIFVDGTKVATVPANQSRGDLVGAFGNNPQAEFHGWTYNVPATASWRNGQNRIITARACGANGDISGSPKNVACTGGTGTQPPPPPPPTTCASGNFSGYFDTGACGVMNGWALDQNNFNRTVNVEIRVDGVLVATVPANQSRPDLVSGFGGNPAAEFHGWWYYPPANASWKNGTNRTVTARICGANGDLNASPKTVNCTGGSGGCTPPGAPSISANPSSINAGGSATLTASGCGGSVSWSGGQTGNSTVVSPSATTSYTATCTVGGCVSATSNSVTVTVNGGGSTCAGGNFTGQFDTGACGVMNGWALDQNNFNRTVNVEIRVDGVLVATVPANQSRADLVGAFGNNPAAEFRSVEPSRLVVLRANQRTMAEWHQDRFNPHLRCIV